MKLHPAALPIVASLLGGCAAPPAPPSYVATTLQPTAGNSAAERCGSSPMARMSASAVA